jgi:hypothetical protein
MFGITYFDYNFSDPNAANDAFNEMVDTLVEYNGGVYVCKLLLNQGITAGELTDQMGFDSDDVKEAQAELDEEDNA